MLPILYSFRRCPYAVRARMAIKYSKIDVEIREIDLKKIPDELVLISPKATVPVILQPDGKVIDESWDIVKWAIAQNDPDCWQGIDGCYVIDAEVLVKTNDHSFKIDLDHYKYADRYPKYPMQHYRDEGEKFLAELEQRLTITRFLSSDKISISDIAIFPFIRQFANVDKNWFDSTPYPKLKTWLNDSL